MKLKAILGALLLLLAGAGLAQSSRPEPDAVAYSVQGHGPAYTEQAGGPVSYASVTEVNALLSQIEATSKSTQADLTALRIERWKTDSRSKKQVLGDVDSIQRNLQNALPDMLVQLRSSPEDLPATFKLYRNLEALYDVLGSVVESAGAFGSKDEYQSLANDLNGFEGTRRQIAQRIENLASAKEQEIERLRTDLKAAQAAIPAAAPPKKVIVDDTEPPKKPPVKKKTPAKKPASKTTAKPSGTKQTQPDTQTPNPQ
ncbi:MAG TPA: hypothetical protein VMU61_16235 [Candidatus Aquilonibacter sp.]|nr:hypothetical protein [Candidatus Aquilonibacter sp.]